MPAVDWSSTKGLASPEELEIKQLSPLEEHLSVSPSQDRRRLSGRRDPRADAVVEPQADDVEAAFSSWVCFYHADRGRKAVEPLENYELREISICNFAEDEVFPFGKKNDRAPSSDLVLKTPAVSARLAAGVVKAWSWAFRVLSNGYATLCNRNRPTADCWIESYTGEKASCFANISGTVLPVEFPSRLLQFHGLKEGDHFHWKIASDGTPRLGDIRQIASTQQSLPPHLERDIDRIYEESKGVSAEDILAKLSDD